MSITVECKSRPEGSKPKALRREGLIPVALYGHKGAESVSLTMPAQEARMLLRDAAVNNTLVDISVPDISYSGKALIREVQAHPWKRTLYHLSFFSVPEGQTINLVVPVEIVGSSSAVKEGGILEQNLTELNISCTPKNIPQSIEIDISDFSIGTNLNVSDVVLPDGVTVLDDGEQTVFSIVAPAKRSEDTEALEGELDAGEIPAE